MRGDATSTLGVSRVRTSAAPLLCCLALVLGCVIALQGAQPTPPSTSTLRELWATSLGSANPSGHYRYSLCSDGGVVAFAPPGYVFLLGPDGAVTHQRASTGLQPVASMHCLDEAVLLTRVTSSGLPEIVRLSRLDLEELERVPIRGDGTEVIAGSAALDGELWLVLADPTKGMLAQVSAGTVVRRIGMALPRLGRPFGNTAIVAPLFKRKVDERYVFLQTTDYSVLEFDGAGLLMRLWRRDDSDFKVPLAPPVPGAVAEDSTVIGAAMADSGLLAVQVNKRGPTRCQSYVEVLNPDYSLRHTLTLPRKGFLFGMDEAGAFYFSHANPGGHVIWKGTPQ